MSLNYEIMPVKDMFIDITELDDQFVKQDTNTMASIYKGTSGYYYIIPAIGPLGIKSSSKFSLDRVGQELDN